MRAEMGLALLIGGCLSLLALFFLSRTRRRAAYDAAVGLSLEQLVELLPLNLHGRTYVRFMVGPSDPGRIRVGLIYRDAGVRKGNPANVGLEFDAESGELLEVREGGVPLGLK